MIDLHPIKCNICGGRVIYTSNTAIYGKAYMAVCKIKEGE